MAVHSPTDAARRDHVCRQSFAVDIEVGRLVGADRRDNPVPVADLARLAMAVAVVVADNRLFRLLYPLHGLLADTAVVHHTGAVVGTAPHIVVAWAVLVRQEEAEHKQAEERAADRKERERKTDSVTVTEAEQRAPALAVTLKWCCCWWIVERCDSVAVIAFVSHSKCATFLRRNRN